MSSTNLYNEFPPVSAKAWKQKIQMDLKGADYNEALIWESFEGINVKPFYHSEDFEGDLPKIPQPETWYIGQHIFAGNAQKANQKALDALARGAESLVFSVPSDEVSIDTLLDNIDLKHIPLYFDFQFLSTDYIETLIKCVGNTKGSIQLNIDIIGHLAHSGNWFYSMEKDHELLHNIIDLTKNHPTINVLGVTSSLYQNAGANRVQELAYALAHAHEYLANFDDVAASTNTICFKVAIGSNYFFEIAKLRALRWLWNTVAAEYNMKTDCYILAIPSKRNKTLYDYNVNMLRTTTECMSAVLGGANTVCNLSYDTLYHKDNEFGERIARNQLILLKGESYFDKTANPADGAYYIESLTHQLAAKALDLFKKMEASGGFLEQLKSHTIQKKIKESAAKEQELFNVGKEVLVGTNKYENEKDKMKDALELYPFVKTDARKTLIEPILEKRLAEEVEQKRLDHE